MARYSGKSCRLLSMLGLTASFFVVEIIVGYVTNSIALVADSFHMFSDVVALVVGFASVRISKWKSTKNTFGWARAEVLGALVNAVFLIALCFTITIEALKRFIKVEKIDNPMLMLIVGGAGLVVNVIGLCLFHNHSHSHGGGGGHSHCHGDHSHEQEYPNPEREMETLMSGNSESNGHVVNEDSRSRDGVHVVIETDNPNVSSQLNMRGVFLHVLGDALGSVIVVISALLIWFIEYNWKYYVDPAMSIVMAIIMVSTTVPLLRKSSFILLQTVPSHILVSDIKEKLEKIHGVIAIHELHIWQLAGNKLIASVHVHCKSMKEYNDTIAQKITNTFHKEGIHSTTVQPEILNEQCPDIICAFQCGPDKPCYQNTCCADKVRQSNKRQSS